MSPDELEQLVLETKDGEAMRLALKELDEKARKKLSTTASALQRQLADNKANASASDRLKRFLAKRKGETYRFWNSRANNNAALALFAVGPLGAAKKGLARPAYEDREVFRDLVADRRPEWLDEWISHDLDAEWTQLEFPTVRGWVRDGIISKPTCDGYYRLFATHLMRTGFADLDKEYVPPLSKQLLDDPELLGDIEGLFRVESFAFNTNSWLAKGAPPHYETWPQALVRLTTDGHCDRGAMFDLALSGLQADMKQNQLSGYHKFFRQMAPSEAELAARQLALIALLCHPVGHVSKFAIDMLTKLEGANRLDDEKTLRELPSVFSGASKGNGIAALRLLDKVIKRTANEGKDGPSAEALGAVVEGLRHANADVQAKAITLLEPHAKTLNEPQWQEIEGFSSFVAASSRSALARLLSQAGDAAETSAVAMSAVRPAETAEYEPSRQSFSQSLVLRDEERIAPVTSLEELIDLAFHCVEVVESADEIERLVDGISRFADQRPGDFQDRVEPMIHRLKNGGTGAYGIGVGYPGIAENVLSLVLTWATGKLHGSQQRDLTYYTLEDAFVPMIAHLHALAQRVNRREARHLLSSATHQGGWIDPLVWAQRLRGTIAAGVPEDSMDFRLSLLRLAPDNRAKALEQVEDVAGNTGRLSRFALGGDETPQRGDRKLYGAWLTAARARNPQADWSAVFAPLGADDPWPGGVVPAIYCWESRHKAESYQGVRWKSPILDMSVARADGRSAPSEKPQVSLSQIGKALSGRKEADWRDMPTAAVNRRSDGQYNWSSELNAAWVSQWLYYIWPQDPAYAYIRSARKLFQRMDEDASNWTPSHGLFQALFVRGRPWGEAGHLLLALGLVGKDADAKGLATDALIEGIEAQAFDPAIFAEVMERLTAGEWVKYNRLGESLKKVVPVSPLHATAIAAALQNWLPRFDLSQRNAFHVLEALVEAQAVAALVLTDEVRTALGQVSGKSKTANLARHLLSTG